MLSELIQNLSRECTVNSLEDLSFYDNEITGPIPGLGGFSSLKVLYLGENRLNGTINKSLSNLYKLENPSLDGNSFTVSESRILSLIDISSNNFKGPIPRLAPQLAQNGSFCANYKRKYCASKLTHSPHTLASPNGSVSLYSAVALSLERGSLFGCGSLSRRGSLFGCGSLSHRGSLSSGLTRISLLSPSAFSFRRSLSRISLGFSHASRWVINSWREIVQSLCLVAAQVKIEHRSYEFHGREKIRIVSFGSAKDVGLLNGMIIGKVVNVMTLEGWKIEA
ncbi:hypothetical protein CUMW_236460, partial [Citrus unshiu]